MFQPVFSPVQLSSSTARVAWISCRLRLWNVLPLVLIPLTYAAASHSKATDRRSVGFRLPAQPTRRTLSPKKSTVKAWACFVPVLRHWASGLHAGVAGRFGRFGQTTALGQFLHQRFALRVALAERFALGAHSLL